MDEYPIPASEATTEIFVKNSRFVAIIAYCDTVDQARAKIAQTRQQHPTASHCVYAFRIGFGNSVHEGLSDDGEPSGTAGQPVMSVLRGSGLGDTLIVVVRYFGGTKLGTGGLVRAYTEAATEAIKHCPTTLKVDTCRLRLRIMYSQLNRLQRTLTQFDGQIVESAYEHDVVLTIKLPSQRVEAFSATLRNMTGGTVQIEPG